MHHVVVFDHSPVPETPVTRLLSVVWITLTTVLAGFPAGATSSNPPDERTGAPGEVTCVEGCHNTFALNSGPGSLLLALPATYQPGETYLVSVDLLHADQSRWGFELTVLDSSDAKAGDLATLGATTQVSTSNGRQYIKQTALGTADGQPDSTSWSFEWVAPASDRGNLFFYAVGNAANGSGIAGDYIYATVETVPEPRASLLVVAVLGGLLASRW